MSAEWFVDICFSEHYKLVVFGKPVRMIRRASAFYTDGMYFLYLFSYSHECRHRTERLTHEVCVKTSNDDSDTSVCKCLYYFYNGLIEELSFINTYYFYIRGNFKHACRGTDGC